MIRLLLPIVLLLIGVGGGIGAGMVLGGGSPNEAADTAGEETQSEDGGDADGHAANGEGHEEPETVVEEEIGTGPVEATGVGTEYVRLNNQFIVPIVRDGSVRSLVVMGLTIEVPAGQSAVVFDREPRLRDSFLRVLFAHANAGGFNGSFTEASAMAPLREGLRDAARTTLGRDVVFDVLITDITRQDA